MRREGGEVSVEDGMANGRKSEGGYLSNFGVARLKEDDIMEILSREA